MSDLEFEYLVHTHTHTPPCEALAGFNNLVSDEKYKVSIDYPV